MKRKNKVRILICFSVSFLVMLLILVLMAHYEGLKGGIPPLSWQEIYHDLPFIIISSLLFAIGMSIWYYFNFNSEKEKVKNEAVLFFCSFFIFFVFMVLVFKNFDFFKMGAFSWTKIKNSSLFFVVCSLIFAAWLTWFGVGDELIELFTDSIQRKRKNKNKRNEQK